MNKRLGVLSGTWGTFVTDRPARIAALTDGTPPLKFYGNGEIDFEFGPLLLVDYVVMDETSFHTLVHDSRPIFSRLRKTLAELREAGFIELQDYSGIVSKSRAWILERVTRASNTPLDFQSALFATVKGWETAREGFRTYAPNYYDIAMHIPYGPLEFLIENGNELNDESYVKLRRTIFSSRKNWSAAQLRALAGSLTPYLHYAYSNLVLHQVIGLPLMDWQNVKPLYESILWASSPQTSEVERHQEKIRELFRVPGIQSFEPESAKQLLHVLDHKSVRALRGFIAKQVAEDTNFDSVDLSHLVGDVYTLYRSSAKLGTLLNIAAFGFASGTALLTGADPITSVAIGGAVSASQEFVSRKIVNRIGKKNEWLLALLDAHERHRK